MSSNIPLNPSEVGSGTLVHEEPSGYSTPRGVQEARQADYVAFLHRHPYATDAYELGFTVGVREDYRLQTKEYQNVDLPVLMLDNDFRDADLARYKKQFQEYQPDIGIIGDAYTAEEARKYNRAAKELKSRFDAEIIVVPKCKESIEVLHDEIILGYAMGYSDTHADDFSDPADWRGRRVHLLGASPPKQWRAIQQLTAPTLSGEPPADIIGVDWNGIQKVAYKGEFWSRDGWKVADHLTIRQTVQRGLREIRSFWKERGVWPERTPITEYGPAVERPDQLVFMDTGEQIKERETLEEARIRRYQDGTKRVYQNETAQRFIEYREGLALGS